MAFGLVRLLLACLAYMTAAYTCPAGFDCTFKNACPAPAVSCPPGYYCGSYAGLAGEAEIDKSVARVVSRKDPEYNGQVPASDVPKVKAKYAPSRRVQMECFPGYVCSNTSILQECPAGTWCAEGFVRPQGEHLIFITMVFLWALVWLAAHTIAIPPLSACGEGARYQVNFIPIILAAAAVAASVTACSCLIRRQRASDRNTRAKARQAQANGTDKGKGLSSPSKATLHTLNSDAVTTTPHKQKRHQNEDAECADCSALRPAVRSIGVAFKGITVRVPASGLSSATPSNASARSRSGSVIKAENKNYTEILSNVSGFLPAGRVSAIMGPSGSGKTTLLKELWKGLQAPHTLTAAAQAKGKDQRTWAEVQGTTVAAASSPVAFVPTPSPTPSTPASSPPRSHAAPSTSLCSSSSSSSSVSSVWATALSAAGLSSARGHVGIVPQDDVLERSMTVRELLTFNARTRLQVAEGQDRESAVSAAVESTLSSLGLTAVADSIIGGSENAAANISGGQLKRVSIGCELVALPRPAVLLLDEVTAGLDAAIAEEVVATLCALADPAQGPGQAREGGEGQAEGRGPGQGVTPIFVIQQPRPEIFDRIEHLLLLQGGKVVYCGPRGGAEAYFHEVGCRLPGDASAADAIIDALNGITDDSDEIGEGGVAESEGVDGGEGRGYAAISAGAAVGKGQQQGPVDLAVAWAQRQHLGATSGGAQGRADYSDGIAGSRDVDQLQAAATASAPAPFTAILRTFFRHTHLNAARALLARIRDGPAMRTYILLHAIMAVALSVGFTILLQSSYRDTLDPPVHATFTPYCPSVLKPYRERNNAASIGFQQLLFFCGDALGCASALAAIPLFGGHAVVMKREAAAGVSPLAYGLGRMIGDTPLLLTNALVFAGVWVVFGHAGHFYDWLGVIIGTAFAASGIGYTVSVMTRPTNAAVVTVLLVSAEAVFSGSEPSLNAVEGLPVANWLWYLSFASHTAQATYATWVSYLLPTGPSPHDVYRGAEHQFGYKISEGVGLPVAKLIGLGLLWRAMALALLKLQARR